MIVSDLLYRRPPADVYTTTSSVNNVCARAVRVYVILCTYCVRNSFVVSFYLLLLTSAVEGIHTRY